jgi:cytochrome c1
MRWFDLRATALAAALALTALQAAPARAAEDYPSVNWSFQGPLGTFDKASAQRGFLIYQQVCSACHSMKQMYYRNLEGIGLSEAQVKAVAAAVTVDGGVNDQGKPITRPGLPSDHFKPAFANDQAARAANGGALPPDQSVLELAREGGANYIYALLQGYSDPPPGVKVAVLQQNLPRPSDRDAATAVSERSNLHRRHQPNPRPGSPRRHHLPGLHRQPGSGSAPPYGRESVPVPGVHDHHHLHRQTPRVGERALRA